jgi:hypothetical protein
MNPGRTFYNLNIDGGAMWMRRLIDEAVKRENPVKMNSTPSREEVIVK